MLSEAIRAIAPAAPTLEPLSYIYGFRVREVAEGTVEVWGMLPNWRLVITDGAGNPVGRYWCYGGRSIGTLVEVLVAATIWDGRRETEPVGWLKNGQTGELRKEDSW